MDRLNQLQQSYAADGLTVLALNHTNTDGEVEGFISTFGVQHSVARVADDSGYTVPMFGWCFAIDRDGLLLWSGNSHEFDDMMVEDWLVLPESPSAGKDKGEDGCVAGGGGFPFVLIALLLVARKKREVQVA